MTAAELIKLLTGLPPATKVEIFASVADEELPIDLVEHYLLEAGTVSAGSWVMLMDRGCEQGANSRLLWDRRGEYEG